MTLKVEIDLSRTVYYTSIRVGPTPTASDNDICIPYYVNTYVCRCFTFPFFTKYSFSIPPSARALYGIIAGVVGGLLLVVIIILVVIVILAVSKKKKKKTGKMSE